MADDVARVEWLPLREVWRNEAADFTPWLLANQDVLREALHGLEFELDRAEEPIGPFSLDLIGRDLTNGSALIVENQLEDSDHRHLGQLLTYAAGTDARTIVWITKGFRDEHRMALGWLNEHTPEDMRFFGIQVRALRVARSAPAPMLDLVAQPNDWQKTARRATERALTDEHEAYRAFWAPLREIFTAENPEFFRGRAEPRSLWLTMNSPIAGTSLQGVIGSGELRVRIEINSGDRQDNLELLSRLLEQRAAFDRQLDDVDFAEGSHRCHVVVREPWPGRLLAEPERHDEARAWFETKLRGMLSAAGETLFLASSARRRG